MDCLLEFFHSEHNGDLLYAGLHMLQSWLVVALSSKSYTVSTVLFHKYGGANVAVTNCMSHFYMFVPTKSTVKLANGNTEHAQWIGVILCSFPKCPIIYPAVLFYYCPGYPYITISLVALTFYVGFQKVTYEPLENCDFVDPQVFLGDHPTRIKTILTIFKSKLSNSTLKEIGILWSQLYVPYQNRIYISLLIRDFVVSLLSD